MPDADAEKVTLEPDGISFMEALIAREHGEASVPNGFSSSDDQDCSDALEGDGKATISAASEGICPVELHKAALLYPSIISSLKLNTSHMLLHEDSESLT